MVVEITTRSMSYKSIIQSIILLLLTEIKIDSYVWCKLVGEGGGAWWPGRVTKVKRQYVTVFFQSDQTR